MSAHSAHQQIDPETPAVKRQRRPALACRQCRRRKIRCDQNTPCNNCTKSKIADCTYPPTHTPASRRAGLLSETPSQRPHEPVIAHLRAPSSSPARLRHSAEVTHLTPPTAGSSSAVSAASSHPNQREIRLDNPSVDALVARINELEKTISAFSHDTQDHRQSKLDTAPALSRSDVLPEPRFSSQSSWMNQTCLVSLFFLEYDCLHAPLADLDKHSEVVRTLSHAQTQETELHRNMASCKGLGRQINDRLTVDPTIAILAFGTMIPERAVADQFVAGYFRTFEGVFRVLHIPTFQAEYERYWQQPNTRRELFVLQLQVVMALGVTTQGDSLQSRNVASQWTFEAQTWLSRTRTKKKRMSFEELQLTCLLYLAEANSAGPEDVSWVDVGELMRRAMSLNLHRDPKFLGISFRQAELHRRLWATVLELNLLLSLQVGRAPLISATDFDTCAPANLSDEELDEEVDANTQTGAECPKLTCTTVQLALFDSFNLRLKIASRLYAIDSDVRFDELLEFHSDLSRSDAKMRKALNEHSRLDPDGASASTTPSQRVLAETLLSRYFLAIHLPVIGKSIRDPAFHISRRVSITVAIRMAEACGILSQSPPDPLLSEFHRLVINSAGVFRYVVVQAVFAIVLELVTLKKEQRENLGEFPVWDEDDLSRHVNAAQAWAEDRVRLGLTDVHTPCFLAACISYAEAQSLGSSQASEEVVIDAALRSSGRCRHALTEVAKDLGALSAEGTSTVNFETEGISGAPDDWVGDLIMEGMSEGFAFDFAYQAGPGMMPAGDAGIGFMAL